MGGKECNISKDLTLAFLPKAGRCLANPSQRITKKYKTEIREIIDPILATIFQATNMSG